MQLFSADVKCFFAPENGHEKNALKSCSESVHNFFFSTGLAAQTAQKQKPYTTKKPLNAELGI